MDPISFRPSFSLTRYSTADSGNAVSSGSGKIRIEGGVISFLDNSWYEVQYARSFNTIFEGRDEVRVDPGIYNIINHTTGERFENVSVDLSDGEGSGFEQLKSSARDVQTGNASTSMKLSDQARDQGDGWSMSIDKTTRPVSGYDDANLAAEKAAFEGCVAVVVPTVVVASNPVGIAVIGTECIVAGAIAGAYSYQGQMQTTTVIDGERQTDRHPEDDSTYPASEDTSTTIDMRENGDYTVTKVDHLTATTVVYDHDVSASATTTTTITTNEDGSTETTVDFPDGSGECQVSGADSHSTTVSINTHSGVYNGSGSENESNSHGTSTGSDYGSGGSARDANTDETSGYAG